MTTQAAPPEPPAPEEQFWERYSPNQEFPLSWAASVAIHIALFLLFLFVIKQLAGPETPPTPPMRAVAIVDDSPEGQGGGSNGGTTAPKESVSQEEKFTVPEKIPEARKAELRDKVSSWVPNTTLNPELAEDLARSANFDKLAKLGDKLRKDLLAGLGDGKGGGGAGGKGGPNPKGDGEGFGAPADSSARRSVRWALTFEVSTGEDWLRQFAAMKATLLFPLGKSGEYLQVSDATKPREHQRVTALPQESFFVDDRRTSVAQVANACGLDFTPNEFLAFFPKSIEEDLAAKERNFRGRAEKDIIETEFKVLFRNGQPFITVVSQKARR